MMKWIRDRPWIWIVLVFVLLIAAWTVLIKVALNNQPEVIQLIQPGEGGAEDDGD